MADQRSTKPGTKLGFLSLFVAAATVIVWFRLAGQVALPENRTLFVLLFVAAVVLGIAAFVRRTRWYGGIAAVLGIVAGAFLLFTVAISRQEVAPNSIRVGDTIPHFTAVNGQGQPFDSASLQGQLVLMKFFRGHW